MHTYVSTYVCIDSCSHFLLWLAFLFIVVDFVCLRRNCTKREKNFCTLRFGFALLRADLVYTLLLFCFVFVCILFSMLCFKVKCQRRRQHSLMLFLLLWGLVVSQYKKEQRKKATYKHICTLKPTQFIRRSQTHMHICILAAQTFPRTHVHTFVSMYACETIHMYIRLSPRFSISYHDVC